MILDRPDESPLPNAQQAAATGDQASPKATATSVLEMTAANPEQRTVQERVPMRGLPLSYRFAKRLLDVLISGLLLLALFPLFVVVALAIRLTSKGPLFYRSVRIGIGGEPMGFLKFRTMVTGADALKVELQEVNEHDGPAFKMRRDPRITKVGRILRKLSIDELPQLVHVFTGSMTLVGPRPHLACEVVHYKDEWYQRLSVKPGLTCFWQVQGRSDLSFEQWIELDLKYVREMNFWLDLRLIAATPFAVLRGHGAY